MHSAASGGAVISRRHHAVGQRVVASGRHIGASGALERAACCAQGIAARTVISRRALHRRCGVRCARHVVARGKDAVRDGGVARGGRSAVRGRRKLRTRRTAHSAAGLADAGPSGAVAVFRTKRRRVKCAGCDAPTLQQLAVAQLRGARGRGRAAGRATEARRQAGGVGKVSMGAWRAHRSGLLIRAGLADCGRRARRPRSAHVACNRLIPVAGDVVVGSYVAVTALGAAAGRGSAQVCARRNPGRRSDGVDERHVSSAHLHACMAAVVVPARVGANHRTSSSGTCKGDACAAHRQAAHWRQASHVACVAVRSHQAGAGEHAISGVAGSAA